MTRSTTCDITNVHMELCILYCGLFVVAMAIRTLNMHESSYVTWDEAHFGPQIGFSLARRFYFDIHPPLGKLLFALCAYVTDFDNTFPFQPGQAYPSDLNITSLRWFSACFGALCVPLTYAIGRNLQLHGFNVWLITVMVLCDHSYTTISRFVLLDPILLFFTLLSIKFWTDCQSLLDTAPFSARLPSLIRAGFSVGLACCTKWSGLLTLSTLVIFTIIRTCKQEYAIGSKYSRRCYRLSVSMCALVLLPCLTYIGIFSIHFCLLNRSGPGDGYMSAQFQSLLHGSHVGKSGPKFVRSDQSVTLKNFGYSGGLLWSSARKYPSSRKNYQITCTSTKLSTSQLWVFMPQKTISDPSRTGTDEIQQGMKVRIMSSDKKFYLTAQSQAAPLTKKHKMTAGILSADLFTGEETWIIEDYASCSKAISEPIKLISTTFRLRNLLHDCYLAAGFETLPAWGMSQVETTCVPADMALQRDTLWLVEEQFDTSIVAHANSVPVGIHHPALSFLRNMADIHVAMWKVHRRFSRSPDKYGKLASQPWHWPLMQTAMRMTSWSSNRTRYILLGNPFVYFTSTLSVFVAPILSMVRLGQPKGRRSSPYHAKSGYSFSLAGWAIHFLPYMLMDRPLYSHHYLPALFFAILTTGCVAEQVLYGLPRFLRSVTYMLLYVVLFWNFWYFRAFSLGMKGSHSDWQHLQWFSSWQIR
ncbi:PMT-domain-containing protein [Aureobasidium namibiae CBS 147.97]|uniref:Dolichyl-phosphate-mannose--protein mannosyltransferase n=1 Tax=Aureobasidium namibiae CBS 147.97 TaxID=1043004 RepID=A0A074W4Z8_9PEZI|nr:PMT-domain-containing protein [Aureobasidium namibiae CBS 147.97]KEQ68200.1 PMT-domain-containing protein [Aureobasidium namibiae CBS 147.97]